MSQQTMRDALAPAASAAAASFASSAAEAGTLPPSTPIDLAANNGAAAGASSASLSVWFRRLDVRGARWACLLDTSVSGATLLVDVRAALMHQTGISVPSSLVRVLAVQHSGMGAPPSDATAVFINELGMPLLDALAEVAMCPDAATGRVWLLLKVADPAVRRVAPRAAVSLLECDGMLEEKRVDFPSVNPFLSDYSDAISVCAAPVWLDPPEGDVSDAFQRILDAADGDACQLTWEHCYYSLARSVLPDFAEPVGRAEGRMHASALFGMTEFGTGLFGLTADCKPDLHMRARLSEDAKHVPAFQGAVTSVDGTMFDQAVYTTLMGMVRSFGGGAASSGNFLRFFQQPLVGYALVAFPHVGYLISVEMAGVLFVAAASAPFFLGSNAHKRAVEKLQVIKYQYRDSDPAPLSMEGWTRKPGDKIWCMAHRMHSGTFQKIMSYSARTPADFARMCRAYRRLAELPPCPNGVVQKATMSFGWHKVLIEMPGFDDAEDCTDDEVFSGGPVTDLVSDAIAWLATQGILYTDVRGPNVMKLRDGAVRLVDFDDCVALDAPVTSAADYVKQLQDSHAAQKGVITAGVTFAAICGKPKYAEFRQSLQRAFDQLRAGTAAAAEVGGLVANV